MVRTALLILLAACLAWAVGCGSSSGSKTVTVRITSTGFNPKNVSINKGDSVQWLNSSGVSARVVSGRLTPQGNPQIEHIVMIYKTGFATPSNPFTANLGDTIKFNNATGSDFNLTVVDDNGTLVSSLNILTGHEESFPFPSAGMFTFRKSGDASFAGTVTLYGQPTPNGQFDSMSLFNGDTFTVKFDSAGSSYYNLNESTHNKSFMIGSVAVQ